MELRNVSAPTFNQGICVCIVRTAGRVIRDTTAGGSAALPARRASDWRYANWTSAEYTAHGAAGRRQGSRPSEVLLTTIFRRLIEAGTVRIGGAIERVDR